MNYIEQAHRDAILRNEAAGLFREIENSPGIRTSIESIVSPEALEAFDRSVEMRVARLADIETIIPQSWQGYRR
jgi:hypothetical protein